MKKVAIESSLSSSILEINSMTFWSVSIRLLHSGHLAIFASHLMNGLPITMPNKLVLTLTSTSQHNISNNGPVITNVNSSLPISKHAIHDNLTLPPTSLFPQKHIINPRAPILTSSKSRPRIVMPMTLIFRHGAQHIHNRTSRRLKHMIRSSMIFTVHITGQKHVQALVAVIPPVLGVQILPYRFNNDLGALHPTYLALIIEMSVQCQHSLLRFAVLKEADCYDASARGVPAFAWPGGCRGEPDGAGVMEGPVSGAEEDWGVCFCCAVVSGVC